MSCFNNDVALSLDSVDMKRGKKKFTGGNASKRHRDRVNIEFNNLAKLLPFPESVIAKLDKSSILRLAVSYIRAKGFFKDTMEVLGDFGDDFRSPKLSSHPKDGSGFLTEIFSQALDGFLLVLTEDLKVLFVSESVRDYLGYCQAGIIHESFLQFSSPSDHAVVQANMLFTKDEKEILKSEDHKEGKGHSRIARRRFHCRMKCAFSCSSRFYTAYRTFLFSGQLRRCSIQEGRERKILNTLVVLATSSYNSSIDMVAEERLHQDNYVAESNIECPPNNCYASNGFRIEPTLRPHIAPIPVSTSDTNERKSPLVMLSKPRSHPPVLIPARDVYPRVPVCVPPATYFHGNYVCPPSNDCSDRSDDSKGSPASSPNLAWRGCSSSPYDDNNECRSAFSWHTNRLDNDSKICALRSPKYERNNSPVRCLSIPKKDDYKHGKYDEPCTRIINHSPQPLIRELRKRHLADGYSEGHTSHKKSRDSRFRISSLLGLDKETVETEIDVCSYDDVKLVKVK